MIDRATKLRLRRQYRKSRRQVEDIGQQAENNVERHFFKRLSRLWEVRRFLIGWVLLVLLLSGSVIAQTLNLSGYYQVSRPVAGGTYVEGQVGSFTNANPLYTGSSANNTVSSLLFSGLFTYDEDNKLVGNLADRFEISDDGKRYTVTLRNNLVWHDGKPLVADDVVFTYATIQNPDAKSTLATSWKDIKVRAVDRVTITFTLPNALSAFPNSMTNGIVPKHLLDGVPMAQLRSVSFNTTNPIGSGPFKMDAIEVSGNSLSERKQNVALVANPEYHSGRPQLDRFIVRTFVDSESMLKSFENREIDSIAGLEVTPDQYRNELSVDAYNVPLSGGVFAFFRNSNELLKDVKVRQALTRAVDTSSLVAGIGYPVLPIRGPLLKTHTGYNEKLVQYDYDLAKANKLLDDAGWKRGSDGTRVKDGQRLSFALYSQDNSEYAYVAETLKSQWGIVGADVEVILQPDTDLQTTIGTHNYDVLLYGVSLGVDPDVYAYWHSNQADPRSPSRLNFSEYKSAKADMALEAGRTRSDAELRIIKYKPFLEAWRADAPAVALYQPRFLYLTRGKLAGFNPGTLNTSTDRFSNVQNWQIRQAKTSR